MLSLTSTLADLWRGRTTLDAVYDGVAAAIDAREATVRAFVHIDLGAARARAHGLAGAALGGLPLGVKDVFDTADMPTGHGSPLYDGHRPRADAAAVAMARRAGLAVVGKTRTTEFAHLHPTVTTNPRDPARTPGGSSSGSAAAVAAGFVAVAFGTQTAGSTIRPASFCGVAAVKPSFGLVPTVGVKAFSWHLDTVGLFAAGVRDCAVALAAITGRDLVPAAEPPAPRIGVLRSPLDGHASAAMTDAVERAAALAARAGAVVRTLDLPASLMAAFEAQRTIMDHEGALALADERDRHPDGLSPELTAALDHGAAVTPDAYDAARGVAAAARRAVPGLFDGVDVLLTPGAPGAAPHGLAATGDPVFNRLWTLLGVPAVAVPGAVDGDGMPLGLQLLAPFGRDSVVLSAGTWLGDRLPHA